MSAEHDMHVGYKRAESFSQTRLSTTHIDSDMTVD